MSQRKHRLDAVSCYRNATEPDGTARLALTNPQVLFAATAASINRRLLPITRTRKNRMNSSPLKRLRLESDSTSASTSAEDGQLAVEDVHPTAEFDADYTISDSELLDMIEDTSTTPRTTRKRALSPPIVDLTDDDDDIPGPSNAYGLVETAPRCYFDEMPNEVMRKILAPLPILDLLFIISRVSRRFHEIVVKDDFLKWKKHYYRFRYDEDLDVEEEFSDILAMRGFKEPSTNLVACLLFIHRNFRKTLLPSQQQELFSRLAHDRLFTAARTFVDDQVWPQSQQKPTAWVYLCAAMLLAEDSLSAVALLRRLVRSPTLLDVTAVIECCYLLALLLLLAQRELSTSAPPPPVFFVASVYANPPAAIQTTLSPRWHYKIASALYFFENGGGRGYDELKTKSTTSGQLSLHQFVQSGTSSRENTVQKRMLTHEQFRIVRNDLNPGDCVRIVAFAGTGKTTTLLEYVRARPSKMFLVLMFNKDVCNEASKRFPPNAYCITTHSLAYNHMVPSSNGSLVKLGARYSRKFGFKLKTTDVVKVLKHVEGYNTYVRAKNAIATLENFLYTADAELSTEHVPCWERDEHNVTVAISYRAQLQYLADARMLWEKMKDARTTEVRMLHDGYMKLYQLENPTIRRPCGNPYDAILIDEAQDMNPAILDVVSKQDQSPRMFVGDPNQQIYSFRGATNAFEEIKETISSTFYLTQSFRFGPEIAFIGNCWLDVVKGESRKMLIGCEKKARIDGEKHTFGPICIIARYNATIFEHAATIATKMQGKRLSIVGGLEKMNLDEVLDLYQLMVPEEEREELKSNFLRAFHFKSLEHVLEYAKRVFDTDLEARAKLVRNFGHRIPGIVERIRACHCPRMDDASFVLTTAHKAKGMEFNTVWLADDFATVQEMKVRRTDSASLGVGDDDEFNLLYVALTRAKYSLIMNRSLLSFMNYIVNDNFLRIDSWTAVGSLPGKEEGGAAPICDHCGLPLGTEDALVLIRPQMMEPSDLNSMMVGATVWCGPCVVDSEKILSAVRAPVPPFQPVLPFDPSMTAFRCKNDCNRQWIKPFFEKLATR